MKIYRFMVALVATFLVGSTGFQVPTNLTGQYTNISPSVVQIFSEDSFRGTAFLVGDRQLLTAFHVVDGEKTDNLSIKTSDGKSFKVIDVDQIDDLDAAIIKISNDILTKKLVLASNNPLIGEPIFIIGSPSPYSEVYTNLLTVGIINQYYPEPGVDTGERDHKGDTLGFSATIYSGNSGSPVLNNKGEVVGIASAALPDIDILNFGVPVDYFRDKLK